MWIWQELNNGFKRSDYWNSHQTIPAKVLNQGTHIYKLLAASFQGVKILFALAYFIADAPNNEAGVKNNRKRFLPRGEIRNYNVLIDGRNFNYQPIDDLIKQYDEVRKVSTGKGGWLYYRMFVRLCALQRQLQTNCSWFK